MGEEEEGSVGEIAEITYFISGSQSVGWNEIDGFWVFVSGTGQAPGSCPFDGADSLGLLIVDQHSSALGDLIPVFDPVSPGDVALRCDIEGGEGAIGRAGVTPCGGVRADQVNGATLLGRLARGLI